MKELDVFIYCRVMDEKTRDLLDYQEMELCQISQLLHMKISGVVKEVSSEKHFCSYGIQKLIHYIINEKIDAVLVYDETRLAVYDDLYAEFKMICSKHEIAIFTLGDLKTIIFTNSIIKSCDEQS